jgi:hypothetical protein
MLYEKLDVTDLDVGRLNIAAAAVIEITVPAAHTFDATY